MRKEFSQAFKRKSGAQPNTVAKRSKRTAWKHHFICLAFYTQRKISTTESDRDELFEAGLGRKEIEFTSLDLEPKDFRELIYEMFPKLREAGGYQFCRCKPNSREELEPLSKHVLSSPRPLKERVGQGRTYIVPLQNNLTSTIESSDEVIHALCIIV